MDHWTRGIHSPPSEARFILGKPERKDRLHGIEGVPLFARKSLSWISPSQPIHLPPYLIPMPSTIWTAVFLHGIIQEHFLRKCRDSD
jgi:hypothetical protein